MRQSCKGRAIFHIHHTNCSSRPAIELAARGTRSADHDFKPWGKLTPFDIFLPDQEELNFYFTPSKVTSDLIADRLDQQWQASRELTLPFSLHEHLHRMIERTRAGHLS